MRNKKKKCNHESAIVLREFKKQRLTYLRCTCGCNTIDITSYEITAEEAMRILDKEIDPC
jgi:hypothetical protein